MQVESISLSSLDEAVACGSVLISACGYETRSRALPEAIGDKVALRLAFGFDEHKQALARPENEDAFRSMGYRIKPSSGDSAAAVEPILKEALAVARDAQGAILIDISSMTRAWYGGLIRALMRRSGKDRVSTFFFYVPGKFRAPPENTSRNEIVAPVDGFASLAPPDLPVALVLGLGFEPERALGVRQLLDPKRTVLLLPRFGVDDPFYPYIEKSNADILAETPAEWIFEYPLDEPLAAYAALESICGGLEREFRVVLASLGPKLFGLICFLLGARNPRTSVWRVSSGAGAPPQEVLPDIERLIVCRADWGEDTSPA